MLLLEFVYVVVKLLVILPLGNSVEEDASKSKQIAEAIVCKECIDKLDS